MPWCFYYKDKTKIRNGATIYMRFWNIKLLSSSLSRKDDTRVKELFDNIEILRQKFESIERPDLDLEHPSSEAETPPGMKPDTLLHPPSLATESQIAGKDEQPESDEVKPEHVLDTEAELAKLESEFGKVSQDYSTEEVGDWEFDELEKELRASDSATSK